MQLAFNQFSDFIQKSLKENKTDIKYRKRLYQFEVAYDCLTYLEKGNNVALNLPTGTGKTLISNYVSLSWLKSRNAQKVLYITPTRILADQHDECIKWCSKSHPAVYFNSDQKYSVQEVNAKTLKNDVFISTPEYFSNLIKSDKINDNIVESIDLIIIDEFDDFLVFEFGEKDNVARFHKEIEELFFWLKEDIKVFFISATSPLHLCSNGNVYTKAFSSFISERFNPVATSSKSKSISKYIPKARIVLKPVFDKHVIFRDIAIDTRIRKLLDRIVSYLGYVPNFDYLLKRAESISVGRINWGNSELKKYLRIIRQYIFFRTYLYEDMFDGFNYYFNEVGQLIWSSVLKGDERWFLNLKVDLSDERKIKNELHPLLRGKFEELKYIIKNHENEKGVIFVRFKRLGLLLSKNLNELGFKNIRIDSSIKTSKKMKEAKDKFKNTDANILIITRDTGGRGFDLPFVDYAVFYSPKVKEEEMWQELSRIRSYVKKVKNSYFLYYERTNEAKKLGLLIEQMKLSDRLYEFTTEKRALHNNASKIIATCQ